MTRIGIAGPSPAHVEGVRKGGRGERNIEQEGGREGRGEGGREGWRERMKERERVGS